MSAIERAITTEIEKLEKRLAQVKAILDARPVSRILEIRREESQIMEKHWPDHVTIAKLIEPLIKEQKVMLAIAKKQKNSIKLIDEQVEIEFEIRDLKNWLFWEHKKRA